MRYCLNVMDLGDEKKVYQLLGLNALVVHLVRLQRKTA